MILNYLLFPILLTTTAKVLKVSFFVFDAIYKRYDFVSYNSGELAAQLTFHKDSETMQISSTSWLEPKSMLVLFFKFHSDQQ